MPTTLSPEELENYYSWREIEGQNVIVWANGRTQPWTNVEFFLGNMVFCTFTKIVMNQQNKLTKITPALLSGVQHQHRGVEQRTWNIDGVFVDFENITAFDFVKMLEKACSIPSWIFFVYPNLYTEKVVVESFSYTENGSYRYYYENNPEKVLETSFDFSITVSQSRSFPEVQKPPQRPSLPETFEAKNAVAPKTYVVVKGDCLWNIARKFYGNNKGSSWPIIYDANKGKIKNPNLIFPGQEFIIPDLPKG